MTSAVYGLFLANQDALMQATQREATTVADKMHAEVGPDWSAFVSVTLSLQASHCSHMSGAAVPCIFTTIRFCADDVELEFK